MLDNPKIDAQKKALVAKFLRDAHTPKYILGTNNCAEQLAKLVSIEGFIDDFTSKTTFLNLPILKSFEVDKAAIVVSCSLAIYPHSAMRLLRKEGINKTLHYLDVVTYSENLKLPDLFIDKAAKDIQLNYDQYLWIYEKLKDDKSKKILIDLLNFRKNKDISYMSDYQVDFTGQYFENFLNLTKGEVFVDVGAFDGATSIEFIKKCPEYKSVHIFEPSSINLSKAKKNLKKHKHINFFQLGLSDKKALLKFDASSGSASAVDLNGEDEIMVDTLDAILKENASFIKMDIEGLESKAISGMTNHIKHNHPKLAISIYHKPDDIWKIPKQLLSIRPDYDLYIRHYTEGTDETVMFFLPVK